MDSVSSARWQKAEEGLSIQYQLQWMLKKWFYLSISSIASEDANIHVVCHLENEASMSNNKARYTIASCSDRQLKYDLFRALQKYIIAFLSQLIFQL